ncbi:MAG: hypothetical protein U0Y96_07000 [Candidatus Kapaibacterium sp.]|nr:hypothetical protein [Bacteroidota bacterium]
MKHLLLIKDIEQSKMDALLYFLKSWDLDAELKPQQPVAKKISESSLSVGL